MAGDGLSFKQLAWVNRARVPALAIALQGGVAIVIAFVASRYEQILNYVVSVDVVFFALTAACVFVFRKRNGDGDSFRVPGHPFTTLFFIAACCVITFSLVYKYPLNSALSFGIMFARLAAYWGWAPNARQALLVGAAARTRITD